MANVKVWGMLLMLGFTAPAQATGLGNVTEAAGASDTVPAGNRGLSPIIFQYAPVMIAQAGEASTARERILGLCDGVPASLAYQGIPYSLGTLGDARQYFRLYEGQNIEIPPTTQVSVVSGPKHGKFVVKPAMSPTGYADYTFLPEAGYLGKDSLTLKVELGDQSVTLMYFFNIQDVGDDEADNLCNKTGAQWKISYTPTQIGVQSPIVL